MFALSTPFSVQRTSANTVGRDLTRTAVGDVMRSAPDVYLAYSRLDRDDAARIAGGLAASGLSVAWDEPIIAPDEHRLRTTETIRNAKAALVLWTPHALDNRVVLEEAGEAARHGKLVGLMHGVAAASLPAGLSSQHAIAAADPTALAAALLSRGVNVSSDKLATLTMAESAPLPGPAAGTPAAPIAEIPPLPLAIAAAPAAGPATETIAAVASAIPPAIRNALDAPRTEPAAKPQLPFVPLPATLVREIEARRPPLFDLKTLESEALEPPIAVSCRTGAPTPLATVVLEPPPAPVDVPVSLPAVSRPRPVLRLRKRAAVNARSVGASAGLAAAGLAVIIGVLLLTSGLLHAFGIGK